MKRTPLDRKVGLKTTLRPKKCPICQERYKPDRPLQQTCVRFVCAIEQGRRNDERRRQREARSERRALKQRREAIKSIGTLTSEAQNAFNAYVRFRDRAQPCISCNVLDPPERYGGAWDCGHYLTVGAHPELRFDEANAHKQCKGCNRPGGATRAHYRAGLVARVGHEIVDWLEGPHEPKRYRADELRTIRATYREKLRDAKKMAPTD